MIGQALKKLFAQMGEQPNEEQALNVHVAATALLIETARADFTQEEIEERTLLQRIKRTLKLSEDDVNRLFNEATEAADKAISLYEFTHLINTHYDKTQRYDLILAMWQVACADGSVDKYEEALIRQVAELLYVPHESYIKAKLTAQTQQ